MQIRERHLAYHETRDMIREMPFAYLHIFPYSVREGTAASTMVPHVPQRNITERARELKHLSTMKRSLFASRHLDQILDIIIEEKDGDGYMLGTANNYLKVRVKSDELQRGTLIFIRSAGIEGTLIQGYVIA